MGRLSAHEEKLDGKLREKGEQAALRESSRTGEQV